MRHKKRIVDELIRYGKRLSGEDGSYTPNKIANRFVDLRTNPNAWLFGVLFDQNIPYEKAWAAPYELK